MIEINIPGWEILTIKHLVSDYSGTLSVDGFLLPGVHERLEKLADLVAIHIITADTHNRAVKELKGIKCEFQLISNVDQDLQKEQYLANLGPENVMAIGNGINDRRMLKTAKVGVAVCLAEGLAIEAFIGAKILVTSPIDALDLLLHPDRLRATLRR